MKFGECPFCSFRICRVGYSRILYQVSVDKIMTNAQMSHSQGPNNLQKQTEEFRSIMMLRRRTGMTGNEGRGTECIVIMFDGDVTTCEAEDRIQLLIKCFFVTSITTTETSELPCIRYNFPPRGETTGTKIMCHHSASSHGYVPWQTIIYVLYILAALFFIWDSYRKLYFCRHNHWLYELH